MKKEDQTATKEQKKEVKKKVKSSKKNKKTVKVDYNPPLAEKIIAPILLILTIIISYLLMKFVN